MMIMMMMIHSVCFLHVEYILIYLYKYISTHEQMTEETAVEKGCTGALLRGNYR